MVDHRPRPAVWMTPEQEQAVVDNVINRGMGIIPVHAALWSPGKKAFMQLIGVRNPKMHGHLMITSFYEMNPDHPVSRGVEPYQAVDEIFGADLEDDCVPFFRAKQTPDLVSNLSEYTPQVPYEGHDAFPLDRVAGWTREAGKGRVAVLNFLCHQMSFWKKSAKEMMWQAARWAMKKEFPESGLIDGPYGMDRRKK